MSVEAAVREGAYFDGPRSVGLGVRAFCLFGAARSWRSWLYLAATAVVAGELFLRGGAAADLARQGPRDVVSVAVLPGANLPGAPLEGRFRDAAGSVRTGSWVVDEELRKAALRHGRFSVVVPRRRPDLAFVPGVSGWGEVAFWLPLVLALAALGHALACWMVSLERGFARMRLLGRGRLAPALRIGERPVRVLPGVRATRLRFKVTPRKGLSAEAVCVSFAAHRNRELALEPVYFDLEDPSEAVSISALDPEVEVDGQGQPRLGEGAGRRSLVGVGLALGLAGYLALFAWRLDRATVGMGVVEGARAVGVGVQGQGPAAGGGPGAAAAAADGAAEAARAAAGTTEGSSSGGATNLRNSDASTMAR